MAERIPAEGDTNVYIANNVKSLKRSGASKPFVAIIPDSDTRIFNSVVLSIAEFWRTFINGFFVTLNVT